MAYEKQIWTDGESVVNAERMNHIENGISNAELEVYSTDEKKIGTWINGKPLYRKVVTYRNTETMGALNQTTYQTISLGVSDIAKITKCEASDNYYYVFPFIVGNGNGTIESCTYVRPKPGMHSNLEIVIINDRWISRDWTIVIEYTKTTDV